MGRNQARDGLQGVGIVEVQGGVPPEDSGGGRVPVLLGGRSLVPAGARREGLVPSLGEERAEGQGLPVLGGSRAEDRLAHDLQRTHHDPAGSPDRRSEGGTPAPRMCRRRTRWAGACPRPAAQGSCGVPAGWAWIGPGHAMAIAIGMIQATGPGRAVISRAARKPHLLAPSGIGLRSPVTGCRTWMNARRRISGRLAEGPPGPVSVERNSRGFAGIIGKFCAKL